MGLSYLNQFSGLYGNWISMDLSNRTYITHLNTARYMVIFNEYPNVANELKSELGDDTLEFRIEVNCWDLDGEGYANSDVFYLTKNNINYNNWREYWDNSNRYFYSYSTRYCCFSSNNDVDGGLYLDYTTFSSSIAPSLYVRTISRDF